MRLILSPPKRSSSLGHRGCRSGELEVDDQQLGVELAGAAQHRAAGVDDDRVAVEDELVLSADEVDVRQHALALGGPASAELEAYVVLVGLVRRTVGHDEQRCVGSLGRGGRAVAPEVLADRERDVDAADLHDVDRVAGDEVADLVADAVVPQVVLGLAGDDRAAVDHRDVVLRCVLGDAGCVDDVGLLVEVADHRDEVAAALVLQSYGERFDAGLGGLDQRQAHREVLERIAGQHHLGEHDQVDALLDGRLAAARRRDRHCRRDRRRWR